MKIMTCVVCNGDCHAEAARLRAANAELVEALKKIAEALEAAGMMDVEVDK